MITRYLPWYALALAVLVAGLAISGVQVSTLLVLLVVSACPLMMMVMMGGHHVHGNDDKPHEMSQRTAPAGPERRRGGEYAMSGPAHPRRSRILRGGGGVVRGGNP
ncbi:DUF2933 domain-containing protein [Nocardia gipuzkoensis]|uniref:DUF2933 domain-containing protein n=1 Tax=Nocardia gipuzkoensis TaxID=2749991 RepID=UPI0024552A25|nr:DUF2933 domain-containing protein [Nocardia gipuzkoensis]